MELKTENANLEADKTGTGFKKIEASDTIYSTGATRDSRRGKGALVWMPGDALFLVSRIYEDGNLGLGERNWENGMKIEDLLDSAERHIRDHISGDREEPHLSQAVWNLLNALQTSIWVWMGVRPQELNNLPDHRNPWKPGSGVYPPPLSKPEIAWLRKKGIVPLSERELGGCQVQ